jgi:hypothetical protein
VLNWLLPDHLTAGPGWLPVAGIALLAIAAHVLNSWHSQLGYAALLLSTFVLAYVLCMLVRDLVTHHGLPTELLKGALAIWSMNILVFASWYWQLDAGGPHKRTRRQVYSGGAFLFPQLTAIPEVMKTAFPDGWRPGFVDYLFLAFNTSTAFSPTDVPVLSIWAKILMMIQSSISLATLALVAARAVNVL